MALIKIRQGMVYTLTGIFFVVAAIAQLEGDTVTDAFGKAGIACAVLTGMSWAIIRILDDAAKKLATAPHVAAQGKSLDTDRPRARGEQTGGE